MKAKTMLPEGYQDLKLRFGLYQCTDIVFRVFVSGVFQ